MSETESIQSDLTLLQKVRKKVRATYTVFDDELTDLINAALADLHIAGVNGENYVTTDPLIIQAVNTYCAMNFGEPEDYDRLKASYDEQKAQLRMATGYTDWGDLDAS